MSLCHEADTRAAFACARFAYSIARSLSKFRPVVSTGSISMEGVCFAESAFMTPGLAIVPCERRKA